VQLHNAIRILALACLLGALSVVGKAQTTTTTTTTSPSSAASENGSNGTITSILPTQADEPALMIKKGGKEIEWRLGYTHSSRNAVFLDGIALYPFLVIGEIGVERVRKDNITTSLSGRYGLRNNLLVEVKVPVRYEIDSTSVPEVSPPAERTVSNFGIGDIEAGLYFQLPRKKEQQIRWVVSASVKSRTGEDPFEIDSLESAPLGSGFWYTKVGLTGVKIADPAAVFWNFGYTVNLERKDIPITVTDNNTGEESIVLFDIKPADIIEAGGGFAYAINSRLSINTSISISWSGSSKSNGEFVPNSAFTTGMLRLGVVWVTDNKMPVDLGFSIGLTDDSPDFVMEYRRRITL